MCSLERWTGTDQKIPSNLCNPKISEVVYIDVLYSKLYNKFVISFVEIHSTVKNQCQEIGKSTTFPNYIISLFSAPAFYDVYVETDYNQYASKDAPIGPVVSDGLMFFKNELESCLLSHHNCDYKNVRIHSVDVRKYRNIVRSNQNFKDIVSKIIKYSSKSSSWIGNPKESKIIQANLGEIKEILDSINMSISELKTPEDFMYNISIKTLTSENLV